MKGSRLTVFLACAVLSSACLAKTPNKVWRATKTIDPVVGSERCVVVAPDSFGKDAFTRAGILYPMVEMSAKYGLLVGVSSGGRYRFPTGDILWRVEGQPLRELRAADNPFSAIPAIALPALPSGSDAASKAIAETTAMALRMSTAVAATSTVASGAKAKEMLAEMLAGKSLLFRPAGSVPEVGLPTTRAYDVGMYTNKGWQPIPLDDSFAAALSSCGIEVPPADQVAAKPVQLGGQ